MNLNTPIMTVECSNESTITKAVTDKTTTTVTTTIDLLYLTIFLFTMTTLLIKNIVHAIKYLLSVGPTL